MPDTAAARQARAATCHRLRCARAAMRAGWMLRIAFVGSFAARMLEPVRAQLSLPCQLIVAENEGDILSRLADVDVLVSLQFSARMAEAAPRLSLLQVPGAGLDRIDRAALRPGTRLANAYGHEAGIAEYIIGAMIALTRQFDRLDASLRQGRWDSQWAIGTPAPPLGRNCRARHSAFWGS